MKSLPLKLAILVLTIFGLLTAGFFAYKPLRIRHYISKYENSTNPAKRIRIVDTLCTCGDNGRKALYKVFREFCISEQVKIPAGSFMMGSEKGGMYETPINEVKLSGFWIDRYEVTNGKYYIFVKLTGWNAPYHWVNGKIPAGRELYPVICVSWKDAKAYADWLDMKLPTEAQWEYACRAGSTTEYCFGDNESGLDEYAWYDANSGGEAHPVGQKKANGWGLYDMHGNIWEWCSDRYGLYYYSNSSAENPKGPEIGEFRVLRGSCWGYVARFCRSAIRGRGKPAGRGGSSGFRLSRSTR